jgi:RNA polymerase sigma-70 factor, ECF subfamily
MSERNGSPEMEYAAPDSQLDPAVAEHLAANSVNWHELVTRVQKGESTAMEELYRLFSRGVRFYLCRQLGPQELDDRVHDTFLIVVQAIQRGDLREPERLMGFVRTIVRRQVAAHIELAVQNRRDQAGVACDMALPDARRNPEEKAIGHQNEEIMVQVLKSMSSRDRDILTRFYIQEQSQERICEEMHLTETQFRLLKSRAKARFGELGRRKLQRKSVGPTTFFVRTIAS